MDMEIVTLTYDSLDALLAGIAGSRFDLRHECAAARTDGACGVDEVRRRYEDRRRDGRLPATFEVVMAVTPGRRQPNDGRWPRAIIRFADRR